MDSISDPESLRGCANVPFDEETHPVTQEEFESVTERVDSHAVVGITNDEEDVLLMNDGSHGWTLIAFPVEPGRTGQLSLVRRQRDYSVSRSSLSRWNSFAISTSASRAMMASALRCTTWFFVLQ